MSRKVQVMPVRADKQAEMIAYNSQRTAADTMLRNRMPIDARVRELLFMMCLPKEDTAKRIGSVYGSDPTALANPFSKLNVVYPQSGAGDLPSTSFAAFSFRDPLRRMVRCVGLQPTDEVTYTSTAELEITPGPGPYFPRYLGPLEVNNVSVAVHGPYLYFGRLGKSDQYRGILASKGQRFDVTLNPLGAYAVYNVAITLYRCDGQIWVPLEEHLFPNTGGTIGYSVPATNYYAFSVSTDRPIGTALPDQYDLIVSCTTGTPHALSMVWGQTAIQDIEDIIQSTRAIRISGADLMYTNTASPLTRQGQIVGIQLPKNTNWADGYYNFDDLATQKKSLTMDVVNGMFGFLKPTSETDFQIRPIQWDSVSNNDPEFLFEIFPESDYLAIVAQVIDPNGRQGYVTLATSMEFTTTNQFFSLKTANTDEKHLEAALLLLGKLPQWHENELHWDDIWSWVKKTASDVWGAVKEVAPIIGAAAPLLL